MRFMVDRFGNQMAVDNSVATNMDFSALGSTVALIVWDGLGGEIENTDGPAVRTTFTDPSPYQPLLNAWMTKVAAATPPLTLAQAKSIKSALVNAIYEAKRTAPITSGGQTYEATNEAVTAMAAALTWGDFAALTAAINASIGTLATRVNVDMQQLCDQNNANFLGYAGDTANLQNAFVGASGGSFEYIANFIDQRGNPTVGLNPFGTMVARQVALSTIVAPPALNAASSVSLYPAGSTTPVSMTPAAGTAVPAALAARRNALLGVRGTKQNQITAIATVVAAISYDATSGWP
jgi:hypothetical protein